MRWNLREFCRKRIDTLLDWVYTFLASKLLSASAELAITTSSSFTRLKEAFCCLFTCFAVVIHCVVTRVNIELQNHCAVLFVTALISILVSKVVKRWQGNLHFFLLVFVFSIASVTESPTIPPKETCSFFASSACISCTSISLSSPFTLFSVLVSVASTFPTVKVY